MADPLNFGALPQQQTGERGVTIQPVQLYPQPAPQPQPVVVDRVEYLREQKAMRDAELRRQRMRQIGEDNLRAALEGGIGELIPHGIAVGEAGLNQRALDRMRNVRVQDFYDQTTGSEAERRQQAYALASQEALRRSQFLEGVKLVPRENDNVFEAGASIYTTKVPGLQQVRDRAEEIGREIGEKTGIPGAGTVGELIGNAVVPVRTWEVAADLLGGNLAVDTVRFAGRRLLTAASEAGFDLSVDGLRKFVSTETGSKLLNALNSETGALKPDEVVSSLEEQRRSINRALKVLRSSEALRVTRGEVEDAFKVATRYAAGSDQREALVQAIEPKIKDLPEPAQKFIRESIRVLPSREARRLSTDAQRARQFARGSEAFDETVGTIQEKAAASFKAFAGRQAQQFTPIGSRFTSNETQDLLDEVVKASEDGRIGKVFDRNRAIDALNLLLTGERLPGSSRGANLEPNEIKLLGKVFGPQFEAAIPRTSEHLSALKTLVDYINLPRALVTALDVSAAGRQGILLAARNPVEWGKSFAPMIRAMASPEGFERAAKNIRDNRKYEDAIRHSLDFSDIGGGAAGEDVFVSRLASKIPFVKGSERGYVMFLDTLRMLTYEKYANRAERLAQKQGWDVERLDLVKQNMAKFLNVASGRGDLKVAGEFVPALNAIFFSPRFLVSRLQSVWAMVRPGQDAFTRQIAFENLGAFVGIGTGMLLAAKAMGADVEVDPRSSDFGKMRFGPTRVDFWGGFQPIARYIAQISTAERKELFTGKKAYTYPGTSVLRFFRSKLAPGGSLIYDYTVGEGKTYNGDDTFFRHPTQLGLDKATADKAWHDFGERIFPLSLQDAIEGYRSGGIGGALAGGGISALGGGISSFEAGERQQKELGLQAIDKKLKEAGYVSDETRWKANDDEWGKYIAAGLEADGWTNAPSVADDLSEMKAKFIDQKLNAYMQEYGLSEPVARAELGQVFDGQERVKEYKKLAAEDDEAFFRDNPDLLQEAIDAGRVPYSKERIEIAEGR